MPDRLGDYDVDAVLGRGSQGVTYRCVDDEGFPVAIKVYPPEHRRMAEQEARMLRAVEHPGVPLLVDAFDCELDGEPHCALVQEYVEGRSLQDLIDSGTFLSEAQVEDLARQLLDIAAHLHENDPPLLHRDIKPANIIFGPGGHLSLVDFGGGLAVQETGEVIGTAGYSSPEQYFDQAEPRSDLYSIGATLLAITTRRHPSDFPVRNMRYDLDGRLACNDELRRLIRQLLEPEPARRPATARQAKKLLDAPPDTLSQRLQISREGDGLTIEVKSSFRTFASHLSFGAVVALLYSIGGGLAGLPETLFAGVFLLLLGALSSFIVAFPDMRTDRLVLTPNQWTLTRSFIFGVTRHGEMSPGFDLRRGSRWSHIVTFDRLIASRFGGRLSARANTRMRAAIRSFLDQANNDVVLDLADHRDDADAEVAEAKEETPAHAGV